jgi:hypothetical protein
MVLLFANLRGRSTHSHSNGRPTTIQSNAFNPRLTANVTKNVNLGSSGCQDRNMIAVGQT